MGELGLLRQDKPSTAYQAPAIGAVPHFLTEEPAEGKEGIIHIDKANFRTDEDASGATPNDEEALTLRRVSGPISLVNEKGFYTDSGRWAGIAICAVEFAERASYFGCTQSLTNNFILNPLPLNGNGAGAVPKGPKGRNQSPGALGLGSVDATAVTQMFKSIAYGVPIGAGILADVKFGRFKTMCIGVAIGGLAHILLVITALPPVLQKPKGAFASLIISLITLALGTGFIKSCVALLICDQSPVKAPYVKTTKSGEKVIVDPQVTIQRYVTIYFGCFNLGGFFTFATTYSERFVGFWLAFLEPLAVYAAISVLLVLCYKTLYKSPPHGSVLLEAGGVFRLLLRQGGWKRMWRGGDQFWRVAKPSYIQQRDGSVDVAHIFWNDRFVDEIRTTLRACAVFMLTPIFLLADGGLGNQMNDMSVSMRKDNVPNDLINNFEPLGVVIGVVFMNYGLYPTMAKFGYPLMPMTRISIGFLFGTATCLVCGLIQGKIYTTSPCGWHATSCQEVSPVSLWWQAPMYVLPEFGAVFNSVTAYELAYVQSPARMKGLVWAISLLPSGIAAAMSLALSQVIQDPYLVWPYAAVGVSCLLAAIICSLVFQDLNTWPTDFMEGQEVREGQGGESTLEGRTG